MRSIFRSASLQGLLVAAVAVAVYAGALSNGFVFDDHELIELNRMVNEPGHLTEILTSHYWHPVRPRGYLYRPLAILSLRIDHLLGEGRPWSFHATNLLLHALVCVVALAALRRAWPRGPAPLIGALLFAVHPIHSEAVAGIAGRADLLAALFVLLSWRLHMAGRTVSAALAFAAGALSKESAVVVPGILLLSDLLLGDRPARPGWRRHAPALAVLAVYIVARWAILGSPGGGDPSLIHPMDNPLAAASAPVRVATAFKVIALQSLLLVFPLKLSSDYSFDQIGLVGGPADPWLLAGLAVTAGALAAAWVLRRRRTGPSFPILFHFVCLAPVSNVLLPIGTIMAERILYLPSLGLCAGLGLGLSALIERGGARRAAGWSGAVALIALFGARTIARVPDWKENLSLFRSAALASPRSVKAQYNLGMEHLKAGDPAAALPWLERAVEIGRGIEGRAEMMRDLSVALAWLGRHEEALSWLEKARTLAPAHAGILVNLGNAYLTRGLVDRALDAYEEALRIQPEHAGARMNHASLLVRLGRAPEAVTELERLTRDTPGMADAWYSLADAYAAVGRRDDAARSLRAFLDRAGPDQAGRIETARSRLAALSE